jgi:hypothetical protein
VEILRLHYAHYLAPLAPALPRLMAHCRSRRYWLTLLPHVEFYLAGAETGSATRPHGLSKVQLTNDRRRCRSRATIAILRSRSSARETPASRRSRRGAPGVRRGFRSLLAKTVLPRCSQARALAVNIVLTTLGLCPTH